MAVFLILQFLLQFHRKVYSDLHTVNESSPLMIPAKLTDRINDLIYLLQWHTVHLPVEFVEVFLDLFVVIGVVLVVALVEHGQNRLTVAVVGWALLNVGFQGFEELFHDITFLLGLGDINSTLQRFQVSVLTKFAQVIRPLWEHR